MPKSGLYNSKRNDDDMEINDDDDDYNDYDDDVDDFNDDDFNDEYSKK